MAIVGGGCQKPAPRPNILLITIDTLRADRLGCYGYDLAQTPHIDRLAREGVRFSNAVSPTPITLPSHASILTGLEPPAHGVRDNGAYALGDEVVTIAERLNEAGYRTQAFVSALVLNRRYNLTQGFDGYDDDLWAEDKPPLFMIRDRPGWKTAKKVVGWLEAQQEEGREEPFFLWVHLFDPHQPYEPRMIDRLLVTTDYDGEVAAADRSVGTILDALRKQGIFDDTMVILTSDHGESLGEHGEQTHAIFIYDATVRVPLILRYPRLLDGDQVYDGPVRSVDIVPTVLAALGLAGGEETQGTNLLPALRGKAAPPDLSQYSESLLAEVGFGMAPLFGVRSGGYKWIRAPKPELYDLTEDPGELHNLYAEKPDVADRLDAELSRILDESAGLAKTTEDNPLDDETVEMLQALGYLAPAPMRTSMDGLDPKDGILIYNKVEKARHLGRDGDWSGAEKLLHEVLEATPKNVTARNVLALAEMQQGEIEEAKNQYLTSLAHLPGQSRVHAMLGNIFLGQRKLEEAEHHYRQALSLTPQSGEVMANLAFVELERGNVEAGEDWRRKALASDPRLYGRFGDRYYERGKYSRALEHYRKLLEAIPDHFEGLIQAGNSARQLEDMAVAADYYRRAERLRPDSPIPPYNRACLAALSGETDTAIGLLEVAIEKGLEDTRLLAEDPDLASVRKHDRYETLLTKLEKRPEEGTPPSRRR